MSKTYRVVYERDPEGWWVASVPAVKGCHTQGRTIEEARRRIREALSLYVENADAATLTDHIRLPANVKAALTRLAKVRYQAKHAETEAVKVSRVTVKVLRKQLGLSVRDAGALMGISGQRVHQLES